MNIFFQLCSATIIGITGANGKSTTAALTTHLLKSAVGQNNIKYKNVWLSGNIGNRPLLTILDQIDAADLVVLELSSFQTKDLTKINLAPKVSLLTNLTPNHLDYHKTFKNYCNAKRAIFKYQLLNETSPAVSVFNADDKIAKDWFDKFKDDPGRRSLKFSADDVTEDVKKSFPLPGEVNLSNLAGAITIAKYFGVTDEQIKSCLPKFKSLPHRLELIAEADGVKWYNDSISTTPQSSIAALRCFDRPKIIIAGGYDKNIPFDELGEEISKNVKAAILIGQTAKRIAKAIVSLSEIKIEFADSLEDAVNFADKYASPGDIVLLSPACASYDMFDNFQQRGLQFTDLVRKISNLL